MAHLQSILGLYTKIPAKSKIVTKPESPAHAPFDQICVQISVCNALPTNSLRHSSLEMVPN